MGDVIAMTIVVILHLALAGLIWYYMGKPPPPPRYPDTLTARATRGEPRSSRERPLEDQG